MVLQTSGEISTKDIRTEFGIATNTLIGINQQSVALLGRTARTETRLTVFYGASSFPTLPTPTGTVIYINSTTSNSNLKNVLYFSIDLSGLNFIVIPDPGSNTNGRIMYIVSQSTSVYTPSLTQLNKNSGSGGFGSLDWIIVLRDSVYIGGGFPSVTDMNNNILKSPCSINLNSKSGNNFFSDTVYSWRYTGYYAVYDDIYNIIFLASDNYSSAPTDSYFVPGALYLNKSTYRMPNLSYYGAGEIGGGRNYGEYYYLERRIVCHYRNLNLVFSIALIPDIRTSTNYNQANAIACYSNPVKGSTNSWKRVLIFPQNIVYPSGPGTYMTCSERFLYFIIPGTSDYITSTDGTQCKYIMCIDILTGISYPMAGLNNIVTSIAFDRKRGWLYACGNYTSVYNGKSYYNISYWDESNKNWNILLFLDNKCNLISYSEYYDCLYLSGIFTNINGKTCNGFAVFKLNSVTPISALDTFTVLRSIITNSNSGLLIDLHPYNKREAETVFCGNNINYTPFRGDSGPNWYGDFTNRNVSIATYDSRSYADSRGYTCISVPIFSFSNNYFLAGPPNGYYFSDWSYSFEMWVIVTSNNQCIIFNNTNTTNNIVGPNGAGSPFLWIGNDDYFYWSPNGFDPSQQTTSNFLKWPVPYKNLWIHICLVSTASAFGGYESRFYINGDYVYKGPYIFRNGPNTRTHFTIGINGGLDPVTGSYLNYFNGYIGYLRVYNKAISEYEVLMKYKATCEYYNDSLR